MNMMKKLSAILILWLPFSLAALASIPVLLWGMLSENETIWRPVGRCMDRLLAALLGWSGDYTLSAELGRGFRLQWLRRLLDRIQTGHCLKAALDEGLLKRGGA